MGELLFPEYIKQLDLTNPDLPTVAKLDIETVNSAGRRLVMATGINLLTPDTCRDLATKRFYRYMVVLLDQTTVRVDNMAKTLDITIVTRRLSRK